jgi:hypothetical protein
MDNVEATTAKLYQDARALPAPPIALWVFAAILAASAVFAVVLA